jgi:hypothetical protein
MQAAAYLAARAEEFTKDANHAAALGQDEDASWLLTVGIWFKTAADEIRQASIDAITDPAPEMAVWR